MEEIKDYSVKYENKGMVKTFTMMFWGLLVTAIMAFLTYSTGIYLTIPYVFLAILEIVIVAIFSISFKKLSPAAVTALYYGYAILNGLTFGTIFACYEINTIGLAFLSTSLLFGGLSLYGATTDRDISKLGTIFTVGLFVGIIMSIINIFLGNTMLDIILDWVMLLIFCGLTAYDIQNLKNMQNLVDCDYDKLYIYCAMNLYLDFINIFLRILSILGRNRRD